jgi:hypothetical protein
MSSEQLAALSDAVDKAESPFARMVRNRVFAERLLDAYRANQIAVIGPDAVERCAAAMAISQGADAEDWEVWLPEATAAIAALKGEAA